jgi:S-formylglutathione hydrolase
MALETLSEVRSFGGIQGVYRHPSQATGTPMTFAVFVPDHAPGARLPVVWYLSGLTCTHANVMEKGEYRRACAALGLILVAPDTSPRGDEVADDEAFDFGQGAGFYLDATEAPWAPHLRNPDRFRSVSAFAPICAPMECPWGQKAFAGYLGDDRAVWRRFDACALIEDGARLPELLVDQGEADGFLEEQLKPVRLAEVCDTVGIDLQLRLQPGYDHSYYFISTFMADHLAWHAQRLHG